MSDPIEDLTAEVAALRAEIAALRAGMTSHPLTSGWELRERGLDNWDGGS